MFESESEMAKSESVREIVVKIIMKNGFCNAKFCFGIALSKTGRPSSTHAQVHPKP
jgi:hypothetical protein